MNIIYKHEGLIIGVSCLMFCAMLILPAVTNAQSPGPVINTGAGGPSGTPNTVINTGNNAPTNVFYLQNPLKFNTVGGIVGGFLDIFMYIAVLAGVLLLIWVGFQFVLSQGNADKMKELKSWLLWIIVGLALIISARILVRIVINTLERANVVDQSVINNANNALQRANNP